jgi:hypothetical protein
MAQLPQMADMHAEIPRYGLSSAPWAEWKDGINAAWWRSYNDVKHERGAYFHKATLENARLAMSGLLVLTYQFYRHSFADADGKLPSRKATTNLLEPKPSLLLLPESFYYDNLVSGYDSDEPEYINGAR